MPQTDEPQLVDWSQYCGQWIALDPTTDHVLAHGPTPDDVDDQVGADVDHVLKFVPPTDAYFAGGVSAGEG